MKMHRETAWQTARALGAAHALPVMLSVLLHAAALAALYAGFDEPQPGPAPIIAVELVTTIPGGGMDSAVRGDNAASARVAPDDANATQPTVHAADQPREVEQPPVVKAILPNRAPPRENPEPAITPPAPATASLHAPVDAKLVKQAPPPSVAERVDAVKQVSVRPTEPAGVSERGGNQGQAAKTAPPTYIGVDLGNILPRYPYVARRYGQEGRVVLRVRVSAAGTAESVSILRSSGYRRLDDEALRTVRRWRFVPAISDDQPRPGMVDVPINFHLEG